MTRLGAALLALVLLGGSVAGADDWPAARVFAVFSDNGRYFVRFVPGESVGDTVGFSGAPKGQYATALLYALQADRGYRLQHEITLTNPVSPLAALVADDGAFITFDNWHNVGFGKVAAIYASDRHLGPRMGPGGPLPEGHRAHSALGVLAILAVRGPFTSSIPRTRRPSTSRRRSAGISCSRWRRAESCARRDPQRVPPAREPDVLVARSTSLSRRHERRDVLTSWAADSSPRRRRHTPRPARKVARVGVPLACGECRGGRAVPGGRAQGSGISATSKGARSRWSIASPTKSPSASGAWRPSSRRSSPTSSWRPVASASTRRQERDGDDSGRLHRRARSARKQAGREPGPTRRQCHGAHELRRSSSAPSGSSI